jgi:predicted GNAT superfamily acetyltransferase
LNINKLGCVCSRYLINHYGTFVGGLNAGMATDRFLAEWWIREPWVTDRLHGAPRAMPTEVRWVNEVAPHPRSGLPVLRGGHLDREEPDLAVEIPSDFQALKRADMGLAQAWLEGLREFFPRYFSRGYRVCGFGRLEGRLNLRHGYLLQREETSC